LGHTDEDDELDRLVLMSDGKLTRDGARSMLSASYADHDKAAHGGTEG
jgi:hypothetical protein